MPKPLVTALLTWTGDLRFEASGPGHTDLIDGDSVAGPSPVQTMAFSVAACMAMDVVAIVRKGRHPVRSMTTAFTGERAPEHPHRFVRIELAFTIDGDVPDDAVARAIELSRARYCSVSNSLRPDIEFVTRFEIRR
jgi:putative redox protein